MKRGKYHACVDPCVSSMPPMASGDGRRLRIDGVEIHDGGACYVIAEIGHNHQGDLEQAKQSDRRGEGLRSRRGQAAEARQPRALHPRVLRAALRQRVQLRTHVRRASRGARALGRASTASCRRTRATIGITFFATAFDFESADFLAELDMPAFKFASGDIRNTPLLRHVAGVREADDALDRRRGPCGRRARGRGDPAAQRAARVLQCTAAYPGRHGRPEPERHHDAARAVPGARDRALRSSERHRDGGRRLHARRAGDREALHAQPRGEGHRPRVLADAGGTAQARARPAARARRARRRRRSVRSRSRRRRSGRWARSSSRRASSTKGTCLAAEDVAIKSPADGGLPPYELDRIVGRRLRRRLAPDENVELDDLEPVEEPVAAHAAPRR